MITQKQTDYEEGIRNKATSYLEKGLYEKAINSLIYLGHATTNNYAKDLVAEYLDKDQSKSYETIRANIYCDRMNNAREITKHLLRISNKKSRLVEKLSYYWEDLFGEKPRYGDFSEQGMTEREVFVKKEASRHYNTWYKGIKVDYSKDLESLNHMIYGFNDGTPLAIKAYGHLAQNMADEGFLLHAACYQDALKNKKKARRLELQYLNKITHECLSEINKSGWKTVDSLPFGLKSLLGFVMDSYKHMGKKQILNKIGKLGFDFQNIRCFHDPTAKGHMSMGAQADPDVWRQDGPGYFETKYRRKTK